MRFHSSVKHINTMFELNNEELLEYYLQIINELFEDWEENKDATTLIGIQTSLFDISQDLRFSFSQYKFGNCKDKAYELMWAIKRCIESISIDLYYRSFNDSNYVDYFDINTTTYIVGKEGGEND